MRNLMRNKAIIAAAALALFAVTSVQADTSDIVFSVTATNAGGSGTFEVPADDLIFDPATGGYRWAQQTPVPIFDEVTRGIVATLVTGNLFIQTDPQINLGFSVQAGDSDTEFTITSALLSFPTISNAEGRASAGLTATDVTGDGATLTGTGPGGGAYLAQYNGFVPGGATFSELVPSVVAPQFGSWSEFENDPNGGGFRAIADPVSDMSAQLNFTLSQNDLASGTTNFIIVPEPASLMLIAIGALALRRR